MSKEADAAFKAGYVMACCNLHHMHDEPGLACDVLGEAGLTAADIQAMDLTAFDLEALAVIRAARGSEGDPISEK